MTNDEKEAYPLEKLYEKTGSMYKLVILAAKRAVELSEGAPKLTEGGAKEKPSLAALREISEGKVSWKLKKKKEKD